MSRSAFFVGVVIAGSLAGIDGLEAAEVRPGGSLDLTISGFAATLAHGGALDNQRQDPDLSTGLDFSTDTEVHVLARGADEATGLEYGATVELEADTNSTANADETWLFVRGGFGELRFGDVEGPVDESVIGAQTIAGGTGGIDGDVVDELAIGIVQPTTSDTATKIRYYTPDFAGFQLGVSYTPNNDDGGDTLATTDAELTDWLEAAATYEGELAGIEVIASAIGGLATVKDEAAFAGGDRLWTWFAGVTAVLDAVELGAGYGEEDEGGLKRRYANLGAGIELGPVYASLTGGRVLDTDNHAGVGKPWNIVLSGDLELMPGLVLGGDIAWFENDLDEEARAATGSDSGLVWVMRLEVVF
jgi:outer membrane protein OmpU